MSKKIYKEVFDYLQINDESIRKDVITKLQSKKRTN